MTAPLSERMLELARVRPGMRVLDLATGRGEPAIPAAHHAPAGRRPRRPAAPRATGVADAPGVVLLDPRDVTHAALDEELVTVYTRDGAYLSALSLQELETRLTGDRFARVHRRALINLEHVVRLEPTEVGGYTARTTGGHAVEVSRQAARDLRKRLRLR